MSNYKEERPWGTFENLLDAEYCKVKEIVIKKDGLYFYCSTGFGKTKFNMNTYERKLKVTGTARNYNTMLKLLSLSAELN